MPKRNFQTFAIEYLTSIIRKDIKYSVTFNTCIQWCKPYGIMLFHHDRKEKPSLKTYKVKTKAIRKLCPAGITRIICKGTTSYINNKLLSKRPTPISLMLVYTECKSRVYIVQRQTFWIFLIHIFEQLTWWMTYSRNTDIFERCELWSDNIQRYIKRLFF